MKEWPPHNPPEQVTEHEPDIIARITFSRHGETGYTDVYPDITNDAIEKAGDKGAQIAKEKGIPQIIIHSPMVRAKGTADAISTGARNSEGSAVPMRESRHIRMSDIPDREKAQAACDALGTQEEIARHHHIEGGVFTKEEMIETPESKRIRLYRALEYLIRSIEKGNQKDSHIVVVSHYELISLLLNDIFGDLQKSFGRYNTPSFGEHADVTLLRTDKPNIVTIQVQYDGKTAQRDFDRNKRSFLKNEAGNTIPV